MKSCKSLLFSFLAATLFGCAEPEEMPALKRPEGKVLIVCYSESANKNTLAVAEWIQQQIGGDIFEIKMVSPYSDSYRKVLKEAKHDLDNHVEPPIIPFDGDVAEYDLIFIGSPVWYGTFAPPVKTFLSSHDLSGKTVIPFCTHGGGGAGTLFEDVAEATPQATHLKGFAAGGSNVVERSIGRGTREKSSPVEVAKWLKEILAL